jgi:hypothetical protein
MACRVEHVAALEGEQMTDTRFWNASAKSVILLRGPYQGKKGGPQDSGWQSSTVLANYRLCWRHRRQHHLQAITWVNSITVVRRSRRVQKANRRSRYSAKYR